MCFNNKGKTTPSLSFDFSKTTTWGGDIYYDIYTDTYGYNTAVSSINFLKNTIVGDINESGYGINAVDIERAVSIYDKLNIDSSLERKLVLLKNNIIKDGYAILQTENITSGSYLEVNGISLHNFFKLEALPYQLLPYRYPDGITIATSIFLKDGDLQSMTNYNDGFFFFMGARAEDKFLRMTSTVLQADETIPDDIQDNVIGLKVTTEGHLVFRYINHNGITVDSYTDSPVVKSGWSYIHLTFCPNGKIADGQFSPIDDEILSCAPSRLGTLTIYVNGLPVLREENFKEFFFKGFSSELDKQLGVPYCIGWGGGTPGLKNAQLLPGNELDSDGVPEYGTALSLQGLPVEKNFGGVFKGGIQKLNIWFNALNSLEIKEDFNAVSKSYNLNAIRGGRVTKLN